MVKSAQLSKWKDLGPAERKLSLMSVNHTNLICISSQPHASSCFLMRNILKLYCVCPHSPHSKALIALGISMSNFLCILRYLLVKNREYLVFFNSTIVHQRKGAALQILREHFAMLLPCFPLVSTPPWQAVTTDE